MSTISASGEPNWYIKQESDRIFGDTNGVYTVEPPTTKTVGDGVALNAGNGIQFQGTGQLVAGPGLTVTAWGNEQYIQAQVDIVKMDKRIEALEAMVNQLIVAKYLDKEAANEPKYDPVRLQDDFYFGTAEGKLIPRNVATQMTDEQQATEAYERAMKVVK